jgi:hypothetical protein
MRNTLWIIPVLLLSAAIGAPNVRADTLIATFTCNPGCVSFPSAPNVTFPAPTVINVIWDAHLFTLPLPSAALPTDTYSWNGLVEPDVNGNAFWVFGITDVTHSAGSVGEGESPVVPIPCNSPGISCTINDSGTLAFSSAVVTPEPSSLALMLVGVGLVLVMRKRIALGLP